MRIKSHILSAALSIILAASLILESALPVFAAEATAEMQDYAEDSITLDTVIAQETDTPEYPVELSDSAASEEIAESADTAEEITEEFTEEFIEETDVEISNEDALEGVCGEHLTFTLERKLTREGYTLTIDGYGDMYDYSSPADVPWNSIRYMGTIKEVIFPSDLTSIGDYAFYDQTLSNVGDTTTFTIPSKVKKIGNHAFERACFGQIVCATTNPVLETIGDYAFYRYAGLRSFSLPDSVVSIGNYSFSQEDETKTLAQFTISTNSKLERIGDHAFWTDEKLLDVFFPSTLKYIGDKAFSLAAAGSAGQSTGATRMTTVNIPASVEYIGTDAFKYRSSITSFTFETDSRLKEISSGALMGCRGITSLVLPDTIREIGHMAFNDCIGLTSSSLVLPSGLTTIGSNAFEGCTGLTSFTVPSQVTSIGQNAFSRCTNLSSVTIPDSVITIGGSAFHSCSSSLQISNSANWIPLGDRYKDVTPFSLTEWITEATYTSYAIQKTNVTFTGSCGVGLTWTLTPYKDSNEKTYYELTISGDGEVMDDYSATGDVSPWHVIFNRGYSLTGINITKIIIDAPKLTNIGDYAFNNMTTVSSIDFASCGSLKTIGRYAFASIKLSDSLVIPSSVERIERYAFNNCVKNYDPGLSTFSLGPNVKYIGERAFGLLYGNFPTLTIPKSVEYLGPSAFSSVGAASIVFDADSPITALNEGVFSHSGKLTSITFPTNLRSIGKEAFAGCSALTAITIPASVEHIGDKAFNECTKLASVTLNEGLRTIGKLAFFVHYYSSQLSKAPLRAISIPDSVYQVGALAFTEVVTPTYSETNPWSTVDNVPVDFKEVGADYVEFEGMGNDELYSGIPSCTVVRTALPYKVVGNPPEQSIPSHKVRIICDGDGTFTITDAESGTTASSIDEQYTTGDDLNWTITPARGCKVLSAEMTFSDGTTQLFTNSDTSRPLIIYFYLDHEYGGSTIYVTVNMESNIKKTPINKVTLDKATLTLNLDETATLNATASPSDTTDSLSDITYEWESSDPTIAVIESMKNTSGSLTSLATIRANNSDHYGTTTVTVTVFVKGKKISSATCKVTILPDPVSLITSVDTVEIHKGETAKVTVAISPKEYISLFQIGVTNSANSVVETTNLIASQGILEINGVTTGETTLTISVKGANKTLTASIKVTVESNGVRLFDETNEHYLESIHGIYGQPLSELPEAPFKQGYLFVGWYTKENGNGELVTPQTILTTQWFLYAHYKPVSPYDFTITKPADCTYQGVAVKPDVYVYDGSILLTAGKDYSVTYKNNLHAYTLRPGDTGFDPDKAPYILITGKGNYRSTYKQYFVIQRKDISDKDVVMNTTGLTKPYNKNVQKLFPVITWGKKALKNNTDYSITYSDGSKTVEPSAIGDYKLTITGNSDYTGTLTATMHIVDPSVSKLVSKLKVILDSKTFPYSGNPITPSVTVMDGTKKVGKDKYEVTYSNNTNPGTGYITVTGLTKSFVGTQTVPFTISGYQISKVKIAYPAAASGKDTDLTLTYTGNALTHKKADSKGNGLVITYKETPTKTITLTEGTDYSIAYQNNTRAGSASFQLTGIGRFSGTLKKTFKISSSSIETGSAFQIDGVSVGKYSTAVPFSKNGATVNLTATYNGITLRNNVDYTVTYKNNKALGVGTNDAGPYMLVKGKGNLTGTLKVPFTIVPKQLSVLTNISAPDVKYADKAGNWTTKMIVCDQDGGVLKEGLDYTVKYYQNYNPSGTNTALTPTDKVNAASENCLITAVIEAAGAGKNGVPCNYEGSVTATYRVMKDGTVPTPIAGATIKIANQDYSGYPVLINKREQLTTATVKGANGALENLSLVTDDSKDGIMVVGYQKNNQLGSATVYFKGCGKYSGVKKATFKIVGRVLPADSSK